MNNKFYLLFNSIESCRIGRFNINTALLLLFLSITTSGCFFLNRKDLQTVEFDVHQLNGKKCAQVIKEALRGIDGIKKVSFNLNNRTVLVTFDTKLMAIKNVESFIGDLGFDVNDLEGNKDKKNKLPKQCQ